MPEHRTVAKGSGSSWIFLFVASLILGNFAYGKTLTGATNPKSTKFRSVELEI